MGCLLLPPVPKAPSVGAGGLEHETEDLAFISRVRVGSPWLQILRPQLLASRSGGFHVPCFLGSLFPCSQDERCLQFGLVTKVLKTCIMPGTRLGTRGSKMSHTGCYPQLTTSYWSYATREMAWGAGDMGCCPRGAAGCRLALALALTTSRDQKQSVCGRKFKVGAGVGQLGPGAQGGHRPRTPSPPVCGSRGGFGSGVSHTLGYRTAGPLSAGLLSLVHGGWPPAELSEVSP